METTKYRPIISGISGPGAKQSLRSLLYSLFLFMILSGCAQVTESALLTRAVTTKHATESPAPTHEVTVIEYPPLNWSLNAQRIEATGCFGELSVSCKELLKLGCDEVHSPRFYAAGLEPPYPIMECIHDENEPADPAFFRQPDGLDARYRSFAILQDGTYRLMIKQSDFKDTFAPVETLDEALSYAMAMTGLQARFDLQAQDEMEFLVDEIAETHVEETSEGYRVYLFDWSHQMGCDTHPFYAVTVLVTPEGEVWDERREEIYRSYACFDFEALRLEE